MAGVVSVPIDSSLTAALPAMEHPLLIGTVLIGMGLVPFLMLSMTSFIKLSVVFGVLRNALGGGQFPSGVIVTLLSLVLTIYIMAPVVGRVFVEGRTAWESMGADSFSKKGVPSLENLLHVGQRAAKPLAEFLRRHSGQQERVFFATLSSENRDGSRPVNGKKQLKEVSTKRISESEAGQPELAGESFFSLLPAFVISELKESFAIGFTLFLPFLVIDLVIAALLVGLGMMMVSPVTISLPFKIILFVAVDGWFLLCRGLVLGYY